MRKTGPKWATGGSLTMCDIVKAGEEGEEGELNDAAGPLSRKWTLLKST
ncbi:hypothetical protein PghCCS26_28750 [Paenibacillus glycanilyticus]|uniref:Uncharacterized protein n=1 Tax=Paenibacillus glycanilyticus TaxID=126569 RepID=A0ABQ6NKX3_9BACL|nr:hypothetical protein PghCCS26_28750 [Paenibacillus glycanilyticus]